MFDDIRVELLGVVSTTPNGYMNKIKKQYPLFYLYLREQSYDTIGESFYNWVYPDIDKKCKVCGSDCAFKQFSRGYYDFCSCSCKAKLYEANKNAHTASGECKGKEKIKAKSIVSREKANNTCIARYGRDLKNVSAKNRHDEYIKSIPTQLLDYAFCNDTQKSLVGLAKELGVSFFMVNKAFKFHGINPKKKRTQTSQPEIDICNFLEQHNIEYDRNNRKLLGGKQEIDIWIPCLRVGIEYCGLFWHSDRNNYPKNKHQDKFIKSCDNNITLITIFEDEWLFKREQVQSRLLSMLQQHNNSIFARKCKVVCNYNPTIVKNKLNDWHLSGTKSASSNISLLCNDVLVAVLTYGVPRYGKEDIEIIRFASLPGSTVVGGFSKCFSHLIKNLNPTTVVSFSDNRWGRGGVYKSVGFINKGITPPSYFYFKIQEKIRYHRSRFMKKYIINQMDGSIDLTEAENMKKFGYNRIYDCGTTKWVWTKG